jgi:ATP-binding cassette, subfamily B, bacterial
MSEDEHLDEERQGRLRLSLWRPVLTFTRPYVRALVGLAVAGLLIAGVDVFLPWVTGRVIDHATSGNMGHGLVRWVAAYFGLVTVSAVQVWIFIVLAGVVTTGVAYDLRRAGFARLQELSFSFFDQRPVGWLMARLTSDTGRVAGILPWFLLDLVWGTSLILGITVMMLALSARLALYVLLIVPPLAAVSVTFQKRLLKSQRAVRRTNSRLTAGFNEAIMGVRTTKTLVREEENLREFQEVSGAMYGHSVTNALQSAVYLPLVLSVGSIGVGLALWKGGVETGRGLTLGTLVAFMQYAAFLYIPIQELAGRFTQFQSAQASAERLVGLLATEPEIKDAPDGGEAGIREIEFDRVSFAYKAGSPVLHDFRLKVRRGETIALVGATGSGKSTVVSLLSRFYEPTEGRILINGVDYRERGLLWLQSQFGIVLQVPHLFSGTIRENIRYARPRATDEEVLRAASAVNAHDFIVRLDKGYDTEVGEGGGRLSTGEKQLISLARAVLSDPQIFVLDEATSSVDTSTERLIQQGIETLLQGRISFVIAHRLSTVRSADRILVLERGRVVEEGTHAELIHRRGRYYRLYANQFAREGEEAVLSSGWEAGDGEAPAGWTKSHVSWTG